jgi:hypothetical protein
LVGCDVFARTLIPQKLVVESKTFGTLQGHHFESLDCPYSLYSWAVKYHPGLFNPNRWHKNPSFHSKIRLNIILFSGPAKRKFMFWLGNMLTKILFFLCHFALWEMLVPVATSQQEDPAVLWEWMNSELCLMRKKRWVHVLYWDFKPSARFPGTSHAITLQCTLEGGHCWQLHPHCCLALVHVGFAMEIQP